MTAKINITTPAGKSLEGFPHEVQFKHNSYVASILDIVDESLKVLTFNPSIHPGDIITIEVL